MRFVLDASVVIAATRPNEPSYAAARARVDRVLQGVDTIVVPAFFVVEVSGALARQGVPESDIRAIVGPLTRSPHELLTLGPKRARAAQRLAVACKLRGPDALYVWTAAREAVPLCTLDHEILTRAGAHAQVFTP